MQMYEVSSLMRYGYYKNKESWEQSRLIAFLIAQTHSSKRLKMEDIMKFGWEQEETGETFISKEDIERLSREAEGLEIMFATQQ